MASRLALKTLVCAGAALAEALAATWLRLHKEVASVQKWIHRAKTGRSGFSGTSPIFRGSLQPRTVCVAPGLGWDPREPGEKGGGGSLCRVSILSVPHKLRHRRPRVDRRLQPGARPRVMETIRLTATGFSAVWPTHPSTNKNDIALAGVAQWIEHWSAIQRVTGSIPSQAHAWVAGRVPGRGHARGDHTLMFLSLSFSLPSPLQK